MKKYEIINTSAERVAKTIFEKTGDKFPSVLSLIKYVEDNYKLKIEVKHTDLSEYKTLGLVYFIKPSIAQILVHDKVPECCQLFTRCHEIAHIIKSSELKYGFCDSNIYSKWGLERFCDRFAAAFLMPEKLFVDKWNSLYNDLWKKPRLAQYFKVSGDAVYYRAKELKLTK